MYTVIYDGRCNLCTSLVQVLEQIDRGERFRYIPMQDTEALSKWQVTPQDCEQGMILIRSDAPTQRWQGSNAAEEIARLLPLGRPFIEAYRALPGLKGVGDQTYAQVRDNRYAWFGERSQTYNAQYPDQTCATCASPSNS